MTAHSATAQQTYIAGADAVLATLSASAEAHRADGDMTRLHETETWLALAREDQAAAVAGVDAEQLAAMGEASVSGTQSRWRAAGSIKGWPWIV